jgi:hypothetical protein
VPLLLEPVMGFESMDDADDVLQAEPEVKEPKGKAAKARAAKEAAQVLDEQE